MSVSGRSPFGEALRSWRHKRGLSQAGLADLIAERGLSDPEFAALGVVSDKAISNLEAIRKSSAAFVRPRPQTVRLLATALAIPPGSKQEEAFYAAAEETRRRTGVPPRSDSGAVPYFVREGREEQLRQLEENLEAVRAGSPRLVLLAGDAGVGKTSMIEKFCQEAWERDRTVVRAWGECTSGATSVEPYLPFLLAMNHLLGLSTRSIDPPPSSGETAVRQIDAIRTLLTVAPGIIGTFVDEHALVERVTQLKHYDSDVQEQLQRGLAARSASDAEVRFDQVVRFLSAIAASGPVIIVLEDLHWASPRTFALLQHLQRQLQGQQDVPILIIGSYRPSDLPRDDDSPRHPLEPVLNELRRQVDNLVIDLSQSVGSERGEAFTRRLVRQLPMHEEAEHELGALLFAQTEGHPLFTVELIRWLQDTGAIQKNDDDMWELHSTDVRGTAPDKIRAVIAERIGRLPQRLRRMLKIASVQGATISVEILGMVAGMSPEDLDNVVDEQLVTCYRLLKEHGPVSISDQRLYLYRFSHALFQEYLYETLSTRERERLHGAIANATIDLLGTGAHAASGEIAFHLERAQLFGDASVHAYAAGALALQHMNYETAANWFQRSESLATRVDDQHRVGAARNGLAAALRGPGHLDRAISLAQSVLADA